MRCFTALLFLLFYLTACSSSSDLDKPNDLFKQKYLEDVKKINQQRTPDKKTENETMYSTPPTPDEVIKDIANKVEYYPYVDIAKIGDSPQTILPNRETYDQPRAISSGNSLSPNIFDLNYNVALYPPFHRIGVEFDAINIPKLDAYGVSTELGEKSYLLAGNDSLQRSVDSINNNKSAEDVEITKMLVAEKKKIQRQGKNEPTSTTEGMPIFSKNSEKQSTVKTLAPTQNQSRRQLSGFIRSVAKNTESTSQK